MAVIRHGRKTNFEARPWLADLVACKPAKVAAVALANRTARTAWVLLAKGGTYRQPGMITP
jgi:transposase